MMQCYRVTDGSAEHDLFLIVNRSSEDRRNLQTSWLMAIDQARAANPDEWNRSDVLSIMRTMGWDILAPNYETIREPLS